MVLKECGAKELLEWVEEFQSEKNNFTFEKSCDLSLRNSSAEELSWSGGVSVKQKKCVMTIARQF